ncbi:hypothetical protein [Desulfovibrio sp. UCD-KL4C]|uniref:hypothetical protein n=1 Tax=Desulfovibrio sp. UCD-KL4C TaxID=2578120 RepID=UPI0025C268C1|nr:hypothetical protein [Desulfovibrio sp. UCD-KL4C]
MATLNNVELFKTGTHTDSSNKTRSWTTGDLQKIANQYDPQKSEAPAVIGHPKGTAPAYGWVKKVWVDGEFLKANFEQVAPEFETALKEGRYKKRSISVNNDLQLQHVAFLGAALPAVGGLKDIEFSASNDFKTYEFSTGLAPNKGEQPKEDDSVDLTAAMAKITELETALKTSTDELKKLKGEGKNAEYSAKLKAAEDKAEAAEKKLSEFKSGQETKDLSTRIDTLVSSGKLLPGDKEKTLNFAKAMSAEGETMDFSAGDGKTEKVSPREAYLRDLETAEPSNILEEFANSDFSRQGAGDSSSDDAFNPADKM